MYQELLREKATLLRVESPLIDPVLLAELLEAIATDIDIRFTNPNSHTVRAAKALCGSLSVE